VRQDSPVLEFSCHGMQHLMLRRCLQYSPLSPTTQAIKLSSTNITARYRNKTSEKLKYIDVDNKHIIHRKVTLKPPAVPALMIRSDFKVYMDEVTRAADTVPTLSTPERRKFNLRNNNKICKKWKL
jgi:hypothetical protein